MRLSLPLGFSLLIILSAPAIGDDDAVDAGALPSVEVMPCLQKCADFVPAEHLEMPKPSWNVDFGNYSEALVTLRYTIGIDGRVHDAAVLNLKGPKSFSDRALGSLEGWTFKPATLDGNPVAESRILNYVFDVSKNYQAGARPEVYQIYKHAVGLIQAGKYDEAEAGLTQEASKNELNFYERGMMANLLGAIALQRKDYQTASNQVKIATDFYTNQLPPAVTIQLYKSRILSSLAEGNLMDAMGASRKLKDVKGFDTNDPIIKAVTDTRATLDTLPAFSMSGRIPSADDGDGLKLYLYRRDFTFNNIKGSLDTFDLSCKQETVKSQVSDAAEWHVPKNWSQCYLYVRGAPGSTFDVVEFAPDAPQTSPTKSISG
jgi:hypothetical protein